MPEGRGLVDIKGDVGVQVDIDHDVNVDVDVDVDVNVGIDVDVDVDADINVDVEVNVYTGLHKLWYPTIRDTSTWSKFGAHGEHGDVFLFFNLGAL